MVASRLTLLKELVKDIGLVVQRDSDNVNLINILRALGRKTTEEVLNSTGGELPRLVSLSVASTVDIAATPVAAQAVYGSVSGPGAICSDFKTTSE